MQKIIGKIFSAPSIRLNTLVVIEIVSLLVVSLGALFFFTRQTLVEETKMDAKQRLDGTVHHVDNILMTIEQSAGNVYFRLLEKMDDPEQIPVFCRRLVESNPNIDGCTIAFKPGFYPGRDEFMSYVRRRKYNSAELIFSDKSFGKSYTKQEWFTETMKTNRPSWIAPLRNQDLSIEPIIIFCLPIPDKQGEPVGVLAVGLSINLLSQIVLETKPSPNSYNILLAADGSYIIHPNREKLQGHVVLTEPEIADSPTAVEAANAMLQGGTGDMSFQMDDYNWYLFYKPFVRNDQPGRASGKLNWSIATIYPESDIFGEYYDMVLYVMGIVVLALLVFYILSRMVIRRQMKPLVYLTESAERIAAGHFDENIPNTKRDDEVGVFYKHFQLMQKSLEDKMNQQEQQRATLRQRHKDLQDIHQKIQEDDQVKTTFLHNVTNRMIAPSESIMDSISHLCDGYETITPQEAAKEVNNIEEQSETILELLSQKFEPVTPVNSFMRVVKLSDTTGKEENHE